MPDTALPRSRLVLPPMALSSCVHSYIMRDTRGTVLAPAQRLNYFPASPLCGIFWLMEGSSVVVRRDGVEVSEASLRITLAGPHTVPMVSANPGPAYAFLLGLLPQAMQAMTGLDLATLVNRTLPLEAVLAIKKPSPMAKRLRPAVRFHNSRCPCSEVCPPTSPTYASSVPQCLRVASVKSSRPADAEKIPLSPA